MRQEQQRPLWNTCCVRQRIAIESDFYDTDNFERVPSS